MSKQRNDEELFSFDLDDLLTTDSELELEEFFSEPAKPAKPAFLNHSDVDSFDDFEEFEIKALDINKTEPKKTKQKKVRRKVDVTEMDFDALNEFLDLSNEHFINKNDDYFDDDVMDDEEAAFLNAELEEKFKAQYEEYEDEEEEKKYVVKPMDIDRMLSYDEDKSDDFYMEKEDLDLDADGMFDYGVIIEEREKEEVVEEEPVVEERKPLFNLKKEKPVVNMDKKPAIGLQKKPMIDLTKKAEPKINLAKKPMVDLTKKPEPIMDLTKSEPKVMATTVIDLDKSVTKESSTNTTVKKEGVLDVQKVINDEFLNIEKASHMSELMYQDYDDYDDSGIDFSELNLNKTEEPVKPLDESLAETLGLAAVPVLATEKDSVDKKHGFFNKPKKEKIDRKNEKLKKDPAERKEKVKKEKPKKEKKVKETKKPLITKSEPALVPAEKPVKEKKEKKPIKINFNIITLIIVVLASCIMLYKAEQIENKLEQIETYQEAIMNDQTEYYLED